MTSSNYPAAHDGVPMPDRITAVLAISIGIVMATLDGSIANIALPSIASDLNVSPPASVWVVNGYQVTIAVLLLGMSSVAEIAGLRRVFWWGLAIFTLASAACGAASSLEGLVAARCVQGIGSACIFATYPALIAYIYPRRMLGRGIGISAMIVAVASALGPTISAALLSIASWKWLFLVNVPIGIVGLAIGSRALPRTFGSPRRFDIVAALAAGLVIALAVIGLDGLGRANDRVWSSLALVVSLAGGAVLLRQQGRKDLPLVPVDLLRLPIFALSVGTSICSYASQAMVLISLPFFFQHGLGWTPVATGFVMTPIPLAVAMIGMLAGRLADRYPAALLCGIGLIVMSCGVAALAYLPADPDVTSIIWRELAVGFGFGLFQAPNNRLLLSAGPRHRSASAGGMLATARLIGQTGGVSLVAVIYELGGVEATRVVLAVACAITLSGSVMSFLRKKTPPALA